MCFCEEIKLECLGAVQSQLYMGGSGLGGPSGGKGKFWEGRGVWGSEWFCLFAHLLCAHIVFEQYLNIPFFFLLFQSHCCLYPPTKIPVLNDQLVDFLNCRHDIIQVDQKHTACHKNKYTCILLPLNNSMQVQLLKFYDSILTVWLHFYTGTGLVL